MGTSQGPRPTGGQRTFTAAGYVMLFVLGALQGMIGSFQYSRSPTPLIAIILVVIIFVTCAACGWGIGTFGAGLLPGVGWILTSFIISMPRPNGRGRVVPVRGRDRLRGRLPGHVLHQAQALSTASLKRSRPHDSSSGVMTSGGASLMVEPWVSLASTPSAARRSHTARPSRLANVTPAQSPHPVTDDTTDDGRDPRPACSTAPSEAERSWYSPVRSIAITSRP